jgi:putative hydrolase of the HAD superfamily
MKIKTLLWDLDDTLYDEKTYVKSGFQSVASFVGKKYSQDPSDVFQSLWGSFLSDGRGKNFDALTVKFPQLKEKTKDLVDLYRTHLPSIEIEPEIQALLRSLKKAGFRMGMITDGWETAQKKKVESLDLYSIFDKIVFSQKNGLEFRKPHPSSFQEMLDYFQAQPNETMMIGNDYDRDIEGAKLLGIQTFHTKSIMSKSEIDELKKLLAVT